VGGGVLLEPLARLAPEVGAGWMPGRSCWASTQASATCAGATAWPRRTRPRNVITYDPQRSEVICPNVGKRRKFRIADITDKATNIDSVIGYYLVDGSFRSGHETYGTYWSELTGAGREPRGR
jgi:hypothetical protein